MTKQTIRDSIRNITGRAGPTQMTDTKLNRFIDKVYLNDLPEQLKTLQLEGWYRLKLQPNVDRYAITSGYLSSGRDSNDEIPVTSVDDIYGVVRPAYVDGYEVSWNQNPEYFYNVWPDVKFVEEMTTGDGTVGPYTFTLNNLPVQRGSVIISADAQSTRDNGAGGWQEATYAGTVNYVTGVVSITFPLGVPVGTKIEAHYFPYQASRPNNVLFFEQRLVFRPIPDRVYEFRVKSLRRPTAMPKADSSPEFNEWEDLIVYGSAIKIFLEDADYDEAKNLEPVFQHQLNLAQRRALKQIKNQRVSTPYSDEGFSSKSNWPFYPLV